MGSRLLQGATVMVAAFTLSTVANAGHFGSGAGHHAAPFHASHSSVSNSYAGVASPAYADAKYGTGSISNTYAGSEVEIFGFSGAPSTVAGLGHNESLRATDCPTNVYNPNGGQVVGCYNVVKPVAPAPIAQTSYYRVVRPIIYVRYPVYPQYIPAPVVAPQPVCKVKPAWTSRYGANGFKRPSKGGCGW